jgi:hypothetical protein
MLVAISKIDSLEGRSIIPAVTCEMGRAAVRGHVRVAVALLLSQTSCGVGSE